jgi:gas vesicle protein
MQGIADRVRQARIGREKKLRMKRAAALALGAAIGSSIGALAGILLAPKTGKETRADIIRRGCTAWEKFQEKASHSGNGLASAEGEKSSRSRAAAEGQANEGKRAIKEQPMGDAGVHGKI